MSAERKLQEVTFVTNSLERERLYSLVDNISFSLNKKIPVPKVKKAYSTTTTTHAKPRVKRRRKKEDWRETDLPFTL